ncbi:MAG TPA: hypothetical protein VIK51_08270 [Vicinamibacteria bacterium]|jgi:hypothetical protein
MVSPPRLLLGPRRYTCQLKRTYGKEYCLQECPTLRATHRYDYVRVESPRDLPPPDERTIDVAILDMNHGWPNLGHDSIVHAVQDAACDLAPILEPAGLRIRALSFEVRQRHMIPEPPGGRFAIYVGTGGPGDIDPYRNDGTGEGTQGIREDPAWERRLFALFDRIRDSPDAALLAVCHSFGVMCRWSAIAQPVLRPAEKGGKSAGILENVLTEEGARHPWFRQLAEELPDHRRLRIVDHRLYDLIAPAGPLPGGAVAIGHETRGVGGPEGEALTMVEWARDAAGVMPRIFAVNHHPEIVDRSRQMLVLQQKLERGEVTREWFEDRARVLTETYPDDAADYRLHLTSDYTLMGPLRYQLYRQVRLRATALGTTPLLHEDELLQAQPVRPAAV